MNYAIILAGGVGSRFGANIPKQYIEVSGKPILQFSIETFGQYSDIKCVIVCVADEWKSYLSDRLSKVELPNKIVYSRAGNTRWESLRNSLEIARQVGAEDGDYVLIHDGARPLVSERVIAESLEKLSVYGAVIPVIPLKETCYISKDFNTVDGLTKRSEMFTGQTPESYVFGPFYKAFNSMSNSELNTVTGSSEIAYRYGISVGVIKGYEPSVKVTTQEDLLLLKLLISNMR